MQKLAAWLSRTGISANAISVLGIVFAAVASAALIATNHIDSEAAVRVLWLLAASTVQLRLLANLMDGMVALASDEASPVGELYNEIPDRIEDVFILIGLGYAAGGAPTMGYGAAVLAVFVAYVRAMGGVAGARQSFTGPAAKPHRMFLVTVVSLYCAIAPSNWQPLHAESGWGAAAVALAIISAGSVITAFRRIRRVTDDLRNRDTGA